MPEILARHLPIIVVANFAAVAATLVALGAWVTRRPLADLPSGRQNAAELALEWFVGQARKIDPGAVSTVAPFLATLFFLILLGNLLAVLPLPALQTPPAAFYSVPLALSAIAVLGSFAIGARLAGLTAGLRHLFWPNPLQLVSEVSHVLSLSLRLYGNIGGEFIVAALVAKATPYGIPLVVHALGLIPAAVQPFVFTLLTANFLGTALHRGERRRATVRSAATLPVSSPHEIESSR
jgi:F-type H+-transporting ATPase subunit a